MEDIFKKLNEKSVYPQFYTQWKYLSQMKEK